MKRKIALILFLINTILAQSFMEEISNQKPLWTGSFGTVSIDGQTYNQISMRPEFNFGNWGAGFDFYLYIDGNGNIYDDSWNFSSPNKSYQTLIDKLKYIRYGYPGDKLYFKVGSLSNVNLGHGILVEQYSNMMKYPEIRRVGFQLSTFISEGIGLEFILSDFKHSPSLLASRINYPVYANFDIGLSFATDINQNAGLDDSDGDSVPDFIDPFPNQDSYWLDTDGDGIPDEEDYDADGDGFDWFNFVEEGINPEDVFDDSVILDPDGEITNQQQKITFKDLKENTTGIGIDFTYHINENFKLYSEFAKLITEDYLAPNNEIFNAGWGMIPFGFKGYYGPFTFKFEYRKNNEHFVYNFWDRMYDLNRSVLDGNEIKSKSSQLYKYGASQGVYFSATGSLFNLLTLGASYQDLSGQAWNETAGDDSLGALVDANTRNFLSTISLNTSSIPKIKFLNGFYQKSNFNKFNFDKPDQNTVFGFDLGIDISDSMILVYKSRTSYEPDGNGSFDKVNSMFVETQVLF
tara:strand:- start:1888 stop:3447 length:1560 start_codon:yes stop_codon:yes gene_type:complete